VNKPIFISQHTSFQVHVEVLAKWWNNSSNQACFKQLRKKKNA